ncbi:hypothetical protein [Desulfonatronum thioautotrophicum]|uniref:hypothetical protein n=1 Tax=Desulfonatronum thioautotrophicum TaxID=617001 RepID=UPI0005EBAF41|nr:hypothetical protein [Desulfonatronum thioautotrophicum]
MPKKDSGLDWDAIRRTLADRVGDYPDAVAVSDAVFDIWLQMSARLSPVIGVRGFNILFACTLHMTSKAYPWLEVPEDRGNNPAVLTEIKTRLANSEPDAAAEACHALLATFIKLLVDMIGESLVERLLGPVWASPPTASEKERVS